MFENAPTKPIRKRTHEKNQGRCCMKEKLGLFLKGLAIGTCDIIPGISGGTIAFITGIYTRLMQGIKSYTPNALKHVLVGSRKEKKHAIAGFDIPFFIPLALGIVLAIYFASYYIPYLLEHYFVFTMSFFVGLIVASALFILKQISHVNDHSRLFGLIGFVFGFSMAYLIPVDMQPTYLVLFFSGFIALFATLLPGISGSYVLLILGQYEYIIGSIRMIGERATQLAVFGLGAILGVLSISRIVSYALVHWKGPTLYFLGGLVLGALNTPVRRILADGFAWSGMHILYVVILFFLGVGVVYCLQKISGHGKLV